MDSKVIDSKPSMRVASTVSTASTGSNQLYIAESLELPEDTFRMSLDNFSVIGENVTIGDRDTSVDTLTSSNVGTPITVIPTPTPTPETPMPPKKHPPTIDTPKDPVVEKTAESVRKAPPAFLQLSLPKNNDYDNFIKPSPVMDLMSPAKMLQFEVNYPASLTPTVKRAAIDFDYFKKNKHEFLEDESEEKEKDASKPDTDECKDDNVPLESTEKLVPEESQVVTKPNTVRHEVGYGKYLVKYFV